MASVIDGKAIAARLRARFAAAVARLAEQGIIPGLAVVLVGDNPASQVYVRNKGRQTLEAGMRSYDHALPASSSQAEVLALVARLNADPDVDGILVQLPLPPHIDAQKVIEAIDPRKDVDGFHPVNAGKLMTGVPGLVPCTPLGCLMLIRSVRADIAGLDAVVVGRSNIVGKPVAQLLLGESCTVTIAHSRTRDLPAVCRRADILVAAAGVPRLVGRDAVKPGATVIDVGMHRTDEGLCGDVDFDAVREVAGKITPVPGGVGPMTIAMLLRNTVTAAQLAAVTA
jgi:methylenetetrahydrofolate dehydrogenase (NADP+) / methenyltetrahydrofolate cyclohydrolase